MLCAFSDEHSLLELVQHPISDVVYGDFDSLFKDMIGYLQRGDSNCGSSAAAGIANLVARHIQKDEP
jgi:hypothetical protein